MKEINSPGALAGKILRVNLSTGAISTEETEKYASRFLGGRSINSYIMLMELMPGVRWSDPENLLCFGAGALCGTMAPGACRVDVSSINVFNGGKGSANVGGFWGPELKYAGYDNIIISGISPYPVYIYISNDTVEIRSAERIWGKTVFETEDILREELRDGNIRVAAIGPAGENEVRGSAVMIDTAKAAGGSGVGCVMGHKKLKAVAVRGTGGISVAEPRRFHDEIERELQACNRNPNTAVMRNSLTTFYSDPDFPGWDSIMVTRNGQDDYWPKEKRMRLMNLKNGVPSMKKGNRACYLCPSGCMAYMEIDKGPYSGTKGEGFWVNTIMGHACRMDITDPDTVIKAWNLTNELGLDGDYVSAGLSWVFELYERGIIDKNETGGLELNFGNGEAFLEMISNLAYRKGLGALLADGMVEASEKIGKNSGYYLIHVKGQPSIEPFRIPKGWGLAVCTSPVAGRHLRGSTYGSTRFGPHPRPGKFDVVNYEGQAEGCYWQARTKEIEDDLGLCSYTSTWSGANFLTPENLLELVNSGLGLDWSLDKLMNINSKYGRNLEKAFNTLHAGFKRADDYPPERFRKEKVKTGPFKGYDADPEEYDRMLDEYYSLWEWDRETGLQTAEGLISIGLDDVAEKLAFHNKLV